MKNSIKRFVQRYLAPVSEPGGDAGAQRLQHAAAALLIGMTGVDDQVTEEERRAVTRAVQSTFQLSERDTEELVQLAEQAAREAVSDYEFTSLLNKGLTYPQKLTLVEDLWAVAFADRSLDKYEEHFVRRIADLLYVSHADFIAAKHRAEQG